MKNRRFRCFYQIFYHIMNVSQYFLQPNIRKFRSSKNKCLYQRLLTIKFVNSWKRKSLRSINFISRLPISFQLFTALDINMIILCDVSNTGIIFKNRIIYVCIHFLNFEIWGRTFFATQKTQKKIRSELYHNCNCIRIVCVQIHIQIIKKFLICLVYSQNLSFSFVSWNEKQENKFSRQQIVTSLSPKVIKSVIFTKLLIKMKGRRCSR